jgi:hypothetical protein
MRTVEFLQYTLQPSTGNEFHQIMRSVSVPLHQAAGIDVVTYGQSQHDPDSYVLIRAFDNPEHREKSLDAFYQSDIWRNGQERKLLTALLLVLCLLCRWSQRLLMLFVRPATPLCLSRNNDTFC